MKNVHVCESSSLEIQHERARSFTKDYTNKVRVEEWAKLKSMKISQT